MELDPESLTTLTLNTLSANFLSFNTVTRENTYAWQVDWNLLFGRFHGDDEDNLYQVIHRFTGNFNVMMFNTVSTGVPPDRPYGITNSGSNQSRASFLTTNMNIVHVNSKMGANPGNSATTAPTVNYNYSFNTIYCTQTSANNQGTRLFQFASYQSDYRSFVSAFPRNTSNLLAIVTTPSANGLRTGVATNSSTTTLDYAVSGVHTFTFCKLRRRARILRQLNPQYTACLEINSFFSTSSSFTQATGVQVYNFDLIDWSKVFAHIPADLRDGVWEVEHNWIPNFGSTQSISTTQVFPTAVAVYAPWCTTFLVACNLCPTQFTSGQIPGVINTLYFQYSRYMATANWYQFPMVAFCDPRKFVIRNPTTVSSLQITTIPAVGNPTYTQNTGVTVSMVNAKGGVGGPPNSNDYYTSGIHQFTFTLLSLK